MVTYLNQVLHEQPVEVCLWPSLSLSLSPHESRSHSPWQLLCMCAYIVNGTILTLVTTTVCLSVNHFRVSNHSMHSSILIHSAISHFAILLLRACVRVFECMEWLRNDFIVFCVLVWMFECMEWLRKVTATLCVKLF